MPCPDAWITFKRLFPDILDKCLPQHKARARILSEGTLADLPNLVFLGARGFPIDLLVDYALRVRFGKLSGFQQQEITYNKTIPYTNAPGHFIIIDFANPNMPTCCSPLLDLVKQIVENRSLGVERRIIILKNIDCFIDKQAFRILLENYSKSTLFVCTTYKIASIDAPIRSRLFHVRIPAPSIDELRSIGNLLSIDSINGRSRNLMSFIAQQPPVAKLEKPKTLQELRTLANQYTRSALPFRQVVIELAEHITKDHMKREFFTYAANIEHKLACTSGGRLPLHIEYLVSVWCACVSNSPKDLSTYLNDRLHEAR